LTHSKQEHPPSVRSGTPLSRNGGSHPPTPRSRGPLIGSNVGADPPFGNLSMERQMAQDSIDDVTQRLYKQGRRKFSEEAKAREDRELSGCTFTPRINGVSPNPRRSATPVTTSRQSEATRPSDKPRASRSATPDRCKVLYTYSQREKNNLDVHRERVIREQKFQIFKSKLENDHHFKRRVSADPKVGERFMASLTI
jgi:hypothetical protein